MVEAGILAELEALKPQPVAARLRPYLPAIDKKMREGVSASKIVETLKRHGLELDTQALYLNLSRWRAATGTSRARKVLKDKPVAGTIAADAVPIAKPSLPAGGEPRTEDSTDVIVSDASDDRSLEAMLDPKRGEKFAEQFMKRPPARWFCDKGSKDE